MKKRSGVGGELIKGRRRKAAKPIRRSASKTVRGRTSLSATDEDVAVARRLEQSLRASEERYALVAEAVAEGIYDWNIKTNALYVSPRLMEIFSFEGTGITSDAWYGRVHPEDGEGYRTALRECFKRRSSKLECQYRIKAADGSYRWVEDHGLPIRDKAGWAIRLAGAVSDITLRHQIEQALRDRDQELDAVLDTIDYGVLFMVPDLRAKSLIALSGRCGESPTNSFVARAQRCASS
jgi:PAS domain S-box-containing protein